MMLELMRRVMASLALRDCVMYTPCSPWLLKSINLNESSMRVMRTHPVSL
jgi:hypothetical protein